MKKHIDATYVEAVVHRHLDRILREESIEIDNIKIRVWKNRFEKVIMAQYTDKVKYVLVVWA